MPISSTSLHFLTKRIQEGHLIVDCLWWAHGFIVCKTPEKIVAIDMSGDREQVILVESDNLGAKVKVVEGSGFSRREVAVSYSIGKKERTEVWDANDWTRQKSAQFH